MNYKRILGLVFVFTVFLGRLYYVGYTKMENNLNEAIPKVMEGPAQIQNFALGFKMKNSRWPKNPIELQKFVIDNKEMGNLDLTPYKNLTFTETLTKTLKMHFDSYKNRDCNMGPSDFDVTWNPPK